MPKIRMKDTTAHSDYGQMLQGEVYEVSDDHAAHLTKVAGLAKPAHADAQTYHERRALQAEEGEELAPTNPSIAQQVAEAGSRPGDRATGGFGTGGREALNAPPDPARDENAPPLGATDEPPRRGGRGR